MMLQGINLNWRVARRTIVQQVSLQVDAGECVGLLGPNGCGKSSLLRLLYRAVKPDTGRVTLRGSDIWQLSARQFARQVAVLTQQPEHAFDCTVREAVMMGRLPHQSAWRNSDEDLRWVRSSLEQVGAWSLADQRLSTLSGGERQRVWLARALAQQPQLLFLDEPTNYLDIRYQLELMQRIRQLSRTTLVVMHDLNLAAQYCDRLYLMNAGKLVAEGSPAQVLTPERLHTVYGVQVNVDRHPVTGRPHISYWSDLALTRRRTAL